jgi:uncharacterized membrane protein YadS
VVAAPPTTIAAPAPGHPQHLLAWCRHAVADLALLLAIAIASWWLHRTTGVLPLPTQTLLAGMLLGPLCARLPVLRHHRPAPEVPLTVGMVLLGAQVDAQALQAVGLVGLGLLLLHQPIVGWCVRTPLQRVGASPRAASLVAVGVGGGSLSAVLAAEAGSSRPDAEARQLAITATLLAGAVGFLVLPSIVAACGLDATECARWAGITMATTAEAVLVGADHSPAAMRATGAMRFLVNLLLWLPVLAHLRRVEPVAAAEPRRPARAAWLAIRRVPGFVYGLGLLATVTLLGGLAAAEQHALGRATNWAFLMVLAGVGMTTRVGTLRQLGLRPLLAALLGWGAATAVMLVCVRLAP